MSTTTTTTESVPPPSLEVRVKPPSLPSSFSPPVAVTVHVSVHNNANTPVTLLNWGSPLDPQAKVLGVFEIRDADSGESVPLDTISFRRMLPPPREDFVEIPAGGAVAAEATLPLVPLAEGHRYTIQAKGWWQAIWKKALEDVPGEDLEKMTGGQRGEFESQVVLIEVNEG
ncbi:hypothetical protein BDW59DRAFT_157901 [Aspergillus cavernicola]|uniref:Uncharacterized protein n=1 Tax=Aspergillus cavernicola TaxID=176166 RepID=A0ABR4IUM7_9EURO